MSEAIKKYPSTFDQSKISLVDKCIGNIDLLPTPLQKIEILYLSGNFISDLQHITQFKYLKTLSLTNNEVYIYIYIISVNLITNEQIYLYIYSWTT